MSRPRPHRASRRSAAEPIPLVLAAALAVLWIVSPMSGHAQVRAPELEPNLGWLNTDAPLRFDAQLRGHVVLLDFWTSCCINCIHVLDDLKYLEQKYADRPFLVIGVHSSKFTNESERAAIRSAVHRYAIRHPVVIDDAHAIWSRYTVRAWPTLVLVGADAKAIGMVSGEGHRDTLDRAIAKALDDARAAGTLAAAPFRPKLDARAPSASGLAFPGKVIADAKTGRLFVADSGHHRVLVTTWPDARGMCSLVGVIGSPAGEPGFADGDAGDAAGPHENAARLNEPQGMAFDPQSSTLYIADRRNHALRAVDMSGPAWRVRTLVGTGKQGYDRAGGKAGAEQPLNSPWDVAIVPAAPGRPMTLCVAMAGSHQLWSVDPQTGLATPIAGSGRENILDGPASDAALAQPSGLAVSPDASRVFFADSEVSAVRELIFPEPLSRAQENPGPVQGTGASVRTIIGTGLFDFGDVDGSYPEARLQHCLGVAVLPGPDRADDRLLVADTFNHKLKLIDPAARTSRTWIGGRSGAHTDDDSLPRAPAPPPPATASSPGAPAPAPGAAAPADVPLRLDEPGGVHVARAPNDTLLVLVADTNNHRVLQIEPDSLAWAELTISGLDRVASAAAGPGLIDIPTGAHRRDVSLRPATPATLSLNVALAENSAPNPEAPLGVRVTQLAAVTGAAIDLGSDRLRAARVVTQTTMRADRLPVEVTLPAECVSPGAAFLVELSFAACAYGDASVCVPIDAAWVVSISTGTDTTAVLTADARPR